MTGSQRGLLTQSCTCGPHPTPATPKSEGPATAGIDAQIGYGSGDFSPRSRPAARSTPPPVPPTRPVRHGRHWRMCVWHPPTPLPRKVWL